MIPVQAREPSTPSATPIPESPTRAESPPESPPPSAQLRLHGDLVFPSSPAGSREGGGRVTAALHRARPGCGGHPCASLPRPATQPTLLGRRRRGVLSSPTRGCAGSVRAGLARHRSAKTAIGRTLPAPSRGVRGIGVV